LYGVNPACFLLLSFMVGFLVPLCTLLRNLARTTAPNEKGQKCSEGTGLVSAKNRDSGHLCMSMQVTLRLKGVVSMDLHYSSFSSHEVMYGVILHR